MKRQQSIGDYRFRGARSFCAIAFLTGLALAFSGCATSAKDGYTLRPAFSVNVGKVNPAWPKKIERLSLAEQEILKMKGRPDMVHVWWLPTGQMVDKMTIRRLQDEGNKGAKGSSSASWIYLTKDEEALFLDQSNYRIIPLSDQLKIVCALGDPQEIARIGTDSEGQLIEQWRYYNQGRFVTFTGAVKTKDEYTSPIPHYLTK